MTLPSSLDRLPVRPAPRPGDDPCSPAPARGAVDVVGRPGAPSCRCPAAPSVLAGLVLDRDLGFSASRSASRAATSAPARPWPRLLGGQAAISLPPWAPPRCDGCRARVRTCRAGAGSRRLGRERLAAPISSSSPVASALSIAKSAASRAGRSQAAGGGDGADRGAGLAGLEDVLHAVLQLGIDRRGTVSRSQIRLGRLFTRLGK